MNVQNNSKSNGCMGTANLIAFGSLVIGGLTFYYTFFNKPTPTIPEEKKTEISVSVTPEKTPSQASQENSVTSPNAVSSKSLQNPKDETSVTTPTKPFVEPNQSKPTIFSTAKKDNLTFSLKECKQSGQFVKCICQVTSEEMDIDLSVYGQNQTRIIDGATGKEFYPINISIGGKKGGSAYYGTQKTIVADYPVDIVIEFGEVTMPINIISKLEMTINQAHTGTGSDKIEFKNIPNNQKINTDQGTPNQGQPAITTAKMGELEFKLNECKQEGQLIKCKCQVKSEEMDVEFSVMGENHTRVFDALTGKEYNTTSMNIGGKTNGGPSSGAAKTIVAGYPVDMTVEFGPVSAQIKLLSKVEMEINQAHTGTVWKKIDFRNIPVK